MAVHTAENDGTRFVTEWQLLPLTARGAVALIPSPATPSEAMNDPNRTSTQTAADQADELVALLHRRQPSVQPVVEARLRILEDTVEADPRYSPAEMLYLRNRLVNCRLLNELQEWGAAEYQLREMARKLRRWEGGSEDGLLVPVLDPVPQLPDMVALAEPVRRDPL